MFVFAVGVWLVIGSIVVAINYRDIVNKVNEIEREEGVNLEEDSFFRISAFTFLALFIMLAGPVFLIAKLIEGDN